MENTQQQTLTNEETEQLDIHNSDNIVIISCDPGIAGAISVLDNTGVYDVRRLPTERIRFSLTGKEVNMIDSIQLNNYLKYYKDNSNLIKKYIVCVLEQIGARGTNQMAYAIQNAGRNWGIIFSLMKVFSNNVIVIQPQKWKSHFGICLKKDDKFGLNSTQVNKKSKQLSIAKCYELYQGINLLPTPRCTKASDGMAEAVLIGRHVLDNWSTEYYRQGLGLLLEE